MGLSPSDGLSTFSALSRRTLLTIAGHDPSSGAGITADLQTFAAHRLFGTSAITALTVQSTVSVAEVQSADPNFLLRALNHVTTDLPPAGIKIGMLGSREIAAAVAEFLVAVRQGNDGGRSIPIVFDPVLHSSSGARLLAADALETLHRQLIPTVSWITPNWSELSALTAQPVRTLAQAEDAARHLASRHPHLHIVATAGDHNLPTDILRLPTGEVHRFAGEHIESTSTHGTGCAFSAALLCRLVLRDAPLDAIGAAKRFVTEAILRAPGLGRGRGPLNLRWSLG
jgi:hydroxymethylpyrimidine/phosphomethylpyrimidine kinase